MSWLGRFYALRPREAGKKMRPRASRGDRGPRRGRGGPCGLGEAAGARGRSIGPRDQARRRHHFFLGLIGKLPSVQRPNPLVMIRLLRRAGASFGGIARLVVGAALRREARGVHRLLEEFG